ncbi:hypothetical protein Tco_1413457, partial [Tanacetum coccineum]
VILDEELFGKLSLEVICRGYLYGSVDMPTSEVDDTLMGLVENLEAWNALPCETSQIWILESFERCNRWWIKDPNRNGHGGDHPHPKPCSKPTLIPIEDLIGSFHWGEMLRQTSCDPHWDLIGEPFQAQCSIKYTLYQFIIIFTPYFTNMIIRYNVNT